MVTGRPSSGRRPSCRSGMDERESGGSVVGSRLNLHHEIRRRVSIDKRDQLDTATMSFDRVPTGNVGKGVITPFDEDVWQQCIDQGRRRVFVEHTHVVDALERCEYERSIRIRDQWAPGTLSESARRRVGIHADDEQIAEGPSRRQIRCVPPMHQVEHPVREHHLLGSGRSDPIDELAVSQDLRLRHSGRHGDVGAARSPYPRAISSEATDAPRLSGSSRGPVRSDRTRRSPRELAAAAQRRIHRPEG